jgi:hypothetical protein
MKGLVKTALIAALLGCSVSAFAGEPPCDPKKDPTCQPPPPPPCDPKKDPKCEPPPPPKSGNCSPGFYKNHVDFWFGIYCDDLTAPTCTQLLSQLNCKGADATCGRSAAAAYLNAQSGCTED